MRFRVDDYRDGQFLSLHRDGHYFETAEDATQSWIETGWTYEHPEPGTVGPDWDATKALLSETALVVDQELDDIVRIVRYEKSQESRLPVAVVRDLEGNEILRATVESQELVTV